jgi:gliding motility-associated protein GldM
MGATNCPETPRQRMISMMYLVLTAMLALNVSKDILDAFVVVNEALEQTTTNFDSKVNQSYAMFDAAESAEPEKAKPYNDKAKKIRELSNGFVNYIQEIKWEMYVSVDNITLNEAKTKTLDMMEGKENYSKPSLYFMGAAESKGKAYEMHEKILEYKAKIQEVVGDTAFKIPMGLNTEGPFYNNDRQEEGWEKHNFDHTVAAACYTLLNKLIGEIRNIEFEVVNYLYGAIDAGSHKFNQVEAKVIPNSRIVFSGDSYDADIIVAAYDSRQNPTVYWQLGRDSVSESMISSLNVIDGVEGVVHLKIPTGGIGDQKFAGMIKLIGPDGKDQYHNFHSSYTVTKPSAAVAAEKMNVFYAGIPNPVSIAAPVAPEKLRISWGGATASSLGGGRYDVTIPSTLAGKEITVSVAADMGSGKTQNMGQTTFRVKSVPEPTVFLGANILGGRQPKEIILANPLVTARMSPDFNYELRWSILSYKMTFVVNGVEEPSVNITGPHFSDQVKSRIRSAAVGTLIEITDVKIQSIAGTRNIQKVLSIRVR